jgi:hypothetical protein
VLEFYSKIQSYESVDNSSSYFLANPLSHSTYALFSFKHCSQTMNTKKIGLLVVLSLSLATVVMGTTGLSLVSPVFAGGDHHDHGEKKCKDNDNNNCNDTHKTQKIHSKVECENEVKQKHVDNSVNALANDCAAANANLKEVDQTNSTVIGDVFGSGF